MSGCGLAAGAGRVAFIASFGLAAAAVGVSFGWRDAMGIALYGAGWAYGAALVAAFLGLMVAVARGEPREELRRAFRWPIAAVASHGAQGIGFFLVLSKIGAA